MRVIQSEGDRRSTRIFTCLILSAYGWDRSSPKPHTSPAPFTALWLLLLGWYLRAVCSILSYGDHDLLPVMHAIGGRRLLSLVEEAVRKLISLAIALDCIDDRDHQRCAWCGQPTPQFNARFTRPGTALSTC